MWLSVLDAIQFFCDSIISFITFFVTVYYLLFCFFSLSFGWGSSVVSPPFPKDLNFLFLLFWAARFLPCIDMPSCSNRGILPD